MNDSVTLQKIMAAYCPVPYNQIDLGATIQDNYVPSAEQDNFAADVCNAWPAIDCTALHNQMFATLKTGNDILTFINAS